MSGGDPYFPLDGNGGYDVEHYRIHDTYRPATDRLAGARSLQRGRDARSCRGSTSTWC